MNSWHSFSPNGRWLVFSSKARSVYTQMYLTHIDENGNDSPAILIDNSTAANRAVNLPEFVNLPAGGLLRISTPAVDMYRRFDKAIIDGEKGNSAAVIAEWEELVKEDPDDARIQNNMGASLARAGRFEDAIPYYQRSLELNPQYNTIHNNLGRALFAVGRLDEAIQQFERGLEIYPDSTELYNNLGRALAQEGRFNEAKKAFERAIEIKPDFADAHINLGSALLSSGYPDEATQEFKRAVESDPQSAEAHTYMGTALYYGEGKVKEALAQWDKALALSPNLVLALSQTAHALAASPSVSDRNGGQAVKLAERAVELSKGTEPVYLDTLAMAYAESGRFEDAIETARRAEQLARKLKQSSLADSLNERIEMYRSGQPYRDEFEVKP